MTTPKNGFSTLLQKESQGTTRKKQLRFLLRWGSLEKRIKVRNPKPLRGSND